MYFSPFPLAEAFAVAVALGVAAYFLGAVSLSGLAGGAAVGGLIYYFGGWQSFTVLMAFFILGSALTRLGYERKKELGAAQEAEGRRGARHALANCAAGLLISAFYKFSGGNPLAGTALVASFATAAADTAGTEAGSVLGRSAFLPTTFRKVEPGTPGAVSLAGTAASLLAAGLIALVGWLVGLAPSAALAAVAASSAFLAAFTESVLGALPQVERTLGNEGMNVLNTVWGAVLCLIITTLIRQP
ncbi:MAG: DUF92 domain-containing protein [Deltaproteobacteria bacterium]|nr:DUF92 domain-containing protein [Deltaproteobacteria bacterium]